MSSGLNERGMAERWEREGGVVLWCLVEGELERMKGL